MRILAIQLGKMGDILQSAELLRRIKGVHPGAEIHLLHNALFSDVAKMLYLDGLVPVNIASVTLQKQGKIKLADNIAARTLVSGLRHYDLIVNMNSSELAHDIVSNLEIEDKIGFASRDRGSLEWLYYGMSFIRSRRLSTLNLVDIYRYIIDRLPEVPHFKERPWRETSETPHIVFQIASRNRKRQWDLDDFVVLANRLLDEDCSVTLVGSSSERPTADTLVQRVSQPQKIENLTGRTSIEELFETLDRSDMLVTGDTGTMHVAAHQRVPFIGLFLGSAYPWETMGYSDRCYTMFPESKSFPCYPCPDDERCPYGLSCHKSIRAEQVANQVFKGHAMFKTAHDVIGQYLIPEETALIDEETYIAWMYRIFAANYFLQTPLEGIDRQPYAFDKDFLRKTHRELKRELKLFDALKESSLPEKESSLYMLRPLVYLQMLANRIESDIHHQLKSFITQFSERN